VKRAHTLILVPGLTATLFLTMAIQASAQQPTQLFAFSCADIFTECAQGANPQALIQASDGNFYGAAPSGGGSQGTGTLFQVTPSGQFTLLFTFTLANGEGPGASLVEGSDGNLYGGTETGGQFGNGVIFKISKSGSNFQIVHSFENVFAGEFFFSEGLTVGKDGNLYGSSAGGGLQESNCPYGCGTIFTINVGTGAFTTLHELNGSNDGLAPSALIQASDGNFYGIANTILFRVTSTGTFTALRTLPGYAYEGGGGVIQASNGKLYGIIENQKNPKNSGPSLFEVALDGSGLRVFPVTSRLRFSTLLSKLLQFTDGNLWLTQYPPSESNAKGAIVSLSPTKGSVLRTVSFDGADGQDPSAPLIQGTDGNLYGTTIYGGTVTSGTANGVVFSFNPGGAASQPPE
jgi:uncharacterized repeat protein (TIGR03803 family)